VPRKTGQWLRWTAAAVVAVGIVSVAPVFGADVPARRSRGDVATSGAGTKQNGLRVAESPLGSGAFETWLAENTDANIPPEALHMLALQNRASHGEFAQAPSQDTQDKEEFDDAEFDDTTAEYDPLESFNRAMFNFNRQVDRFVLKPVARAWNFVVPELAQQSLANAFDNIAMPRRLINSLLQLKAEGAGRELARFFLNISMGVGGFFDVATELGIPRSEEDTGQTLGYYGVGPGAYLVLPFLPPLTVRDAVGFGADAAMQPISYVAPFEALVGMRAGQVVNDRSLNLEAFEEFEQVTFDLYAATRNAYLQRRQRLIEE
jgi:phospholipid-binding lipoprotein MlaA